jgi:hypothetical protein
MMMRALTRPGCIGAMVLMIGGASLAAQGRGTFTVATAGIELRNIDSFENVPAITGAPFSAEATTEFLQMLPDGNRIEQRYSTSLARDARGRTRREQQVALVGPFSVLQGSDKLYTLRTGVNWTGVAQGETPRLVIISDPVDGVSYTLDESRKEARLSAPVALQKLTLDGTARDALKKIEIQLRTAGADRAGSGQPTVEQLGTRQIEGITATGVRTTTTIPAGQIGNLNPINLVTERWFSEELGMAVLITRSDPRSGDTTYRLKNIVRAEPPPDLFTVPSDYKIVDPVVLKKLEIQKMQDAHGIGGRGKGEPTR